MEKCCEKWSNLDKPYKTVCVEDEKFKEYFFTNQRFKYCPQCRSSLGERFCACEKPLMYPSNVAQIKITCHKCFRVVKPPDKGKIVKIDRKFFEDNIYRGTEPGFPFLRAKINEIIEVLNGR